MMKRAIKHINNDMHNIKTTGTIMTYKKQEITDIEIVPEDQMASDLIEQGVVPAEDVELTGKQIIDKYIGDEKTQLNAIYWANEFNKQFRGNWFTIEKVQKKTQFKEINEALAIMQVLCLVGVAFVDNSSGKQKYKIVVSRKQKMMLMNKEIERLAAEKTNALNQLGMQYDMKIASMTDEVKRMEEMPEESK